MVSNEGRGGQACSEVGVRCTINILVVVVHNLKKTWLPSSSNNVKDRIHWEEQLQSGASRGHHCKHVVCLAVC